MKVIGTFDPKQLYLRQKIEKQDSSFAAMLAINLDKKPGEQDVTALFASNSGELESLYEQMTGKKISDENDKTVVFAFWSRATVSNYWDGESLDRLDNAFDEWLRPVKSMTSNQNMKCAVS